MPSVGRTGPWTGPELLALSLPVDLLGPQPVDFPPRDVSTTLGALGRRRCREVWVGAIHVARVYDRASLPEGRRFLVERLWPRGVRRSDLELDDWLRDVAPSTELRRWFGHDPQRWEEFRRRYAAELDAAPHTWRPLLDAAAAGPVVLLYSARDEEHNNAVALRDHLLARH